MFSPKALWKVFFFHILTYVQLVQPFCAVSKIQAQGSMSRGNLQRKLCQARRFLRPNKESSYEKSQEVNDKYPVGHSSKKKVNG